MGLPKLDITFEQLARTVAQRSARGVVALLLEDATQGGPALMSYTSTADLPASGAWTQDSLRALTMALESGAAKVMAVRVRKTGDAPDYTATLEGVKALRWNWLAAPDATADNVAKVATWIKAARARGGLVKAVLGNAADPDCEGVVNLTTTGIQTRYFGEAEAMTPGQYTPRLAGILAGLPLTRSVTGYALDDIVSADASDTPDADLDAGKCILIYNGEGYEVARGVTSLTTAGDVPALFGKIKHVEGADMIAADIAALWQAGYKGQKVNNYANKQSLCAEINAYLSGLSGSVLAADYPNAAQVDAQAQRAYLVGKGVDVEALDDMGILRANTGEAVFVRMNVQLLDAMEDLDITVTLD